MVRARSPAEMPGRGALDEVDRVGEGGAVALGVALDHEGQVELVAALPGEADADHARGVAHVERDLLGRGELGRHDEVALVLAILVVDHDDDLAARDGGDRLVDRGERGAWPGRSCHGSFAESARARAADRHRRGRRSTRCDPATRRRWSDAPGAGEQRARRRRRPNSAGREVQRRSGRRGRRGGTPRPSMAPPSTSTCSTSRRPSSSSTSAELARQLEARDGPGRRGGAVAEHHPQRVAALDVADGELRVVGSHGAGARPGRRRSRPAAGGRRPGPPSPVIHWLEPSGAAVRPSSVAASFSTTHGRPVRRCFR